MFIIYCFDISKKILSYLKILPLRKIAEEYKKYCHTLIRLFNENDNYIIFVLDCSITRFAIDYTVTLGNNCGVFSVNTSNVASVSTPTSMVYSVLYKIQYINLNLVDPLLYLYIAHKHNEVQTPNILLRYSVSLPINSVYTEFSKEWVDIHKISIDDHFRLSPQIISMNNHANTPTSMDYFPSIDDLNHICN